ncbi:catechol 1,2-dioxygenase [Serratia entomophila]|uniref:catechol 1,2-dioxygenase n=1 Tax=Serratia entomophila TaxID=42906 RepID=UPI00217BA479|nr:catechol 1,2-dioxygenase [Serratia entomophila]CAI0740656.1 Catechol 1,2-dioxygenase [Serratia entomophila]CAI0741697.1 Catechol 1,2-dioxygenase [Serratia entomophila]CAI0838480.1 Catechol 1,2-dioxygenase [Serratia entomophila]CAI1587479.1 Catechol 1,2-dioxygenase [Serratia entomophila]CAI1653527.1 Catechol 1,2-dioxygenase [Serratia entomophila]
MSISFDQHQDVIKLLEISSGFTSEGGDLRFKKIMHQLLSDICLLIERHDVTPEEFWQAVNYLHTLGGRQEAALLAAGLGLERYLDLRDDERERAQGLAGGTPRTIEGPLYVANAPLSEGFARMDDGADAGEPMWLHGQVKDADGRPLAGAVVDIWHANTLGNYSFFDKSQSDFNLRRRVKTDADGRYAVRSILPSGYGCPPDGPTQALLNRLGRHGNRPAHIHFFVSAPGHKHLTTQINLSGDRYLWDDFAFATRDELIADPVKVTDPAIAAQRDLPGAHTEVNFDFRLYPAADSEEQNRIKRARALQN